MKKVKQILAILGVVLLLGLYVITLIMAVTDNTSTLSMLEASVVATILIPILMWAYSFIYRLLKKYYGSDKDKNEDK
ncbi:MAG: hypothetical protein SOT58_06780 [Agathobacter sp.]|nr:hypothetical protein [Lachnobacterium sp.]MDY2911738.1 hypothetical protein [Agathobacter sp.]